jgi:hypothetical protein
MKYFTLIFFALLLTIAPTVALSQVGQHKVTPKVIDREVKPRDIFTETIKIENYAGHKLDIFPTVNEVAMNSGGDITEFVPASMSNNTVTVTSWLEIARNNVELMPGETIELPLIIKIHPEAKPGVYHAFIGFGAGTTAVEAHQQVTSGIAPGIIVTLKVDQDRSEFLKLGNFFIDKFVTKPENNAISYTLTNPGEMPVTPTGEIIISNSKGEEVGTVVINPNAESLPPGAETTFKATVPTSGLLGKYKALLSVDYGTAQIASVYDTTFFYVVPWQQLLMIFGALLLVTVIITLILHRRYRDEDDDDDEHGATYIPLRIREQQSSDKEHDINLKKIN